MRCFLHLLLLFFVSASAPVFGGTLWRGAVVHVTDGDTLWVQPTSPSRNNEPARKIRIEGIDAPEICQPYGEQSKTALKKRLFGKTVTVTTHRVDDYGRDVAKLTFESQDVQDIGTWMVSQGHAWSYHYRHSAGPYALQELDAQSARRGLFAASSPTEPRFFRQAHGSCHIPHN